MLPRDDDRTRQGGESLQHQWRSLPKATGLSNRVPGLPTRICVLSLSLALTASVDAARVTMDPPPASVERYAVFEVALHVPKPVAKNPFTEVMLSGEFTPDEGDAVSVKGFCDAANGDLFRLRFCPQRVCTYSFTITYRDPAGTEEFTGQFSSVESGRRDFIRVDPEYPNHFQYENGEHPFVCSKTAWVIGDTNNWKGFLDKMVPRKENCIRFGIETNYYYADIGKNVWPWGGTRSNPDLSRFNPAVWQKLETIISYAAEKGILSEPVIFCTMRRENRTSPDPEMELYWDYLLARLSPFTSIITWQLYNEYAEAKDYQKYMAKYIRSHDPHKHLICSSAGTTADAIWPDEPWMDIAINHSCTDDTQLESRYHAVATRIHGYGKPAWCDETGRENRHGNNSGVHRRKQYWTWNICGDYWCYHSWEGCEGIEDLNYNGPGSEYLPFIRPFWEKTEWWKMQPTDSRILNDPGSQYEWCLASERETVLYMVNETQGASTDKGTVELSIGKGPYSAVFYSPADGSYYDNYKSSGLHASGKLVIPHPPFVDDLVLYVTHARTPRAETTLTFSPVADTYADERNPTSNYGSDTDLRVGGGAARRIAYLKFDVKGLVDTPASAILSLFCMNGSVEGGGSVFSASSDWEETTVTWDTRPEVSGDAFDTHGPVSVGSVYEFDVTKAVTGNGLLSFALVSGYDDGAGYDSREGNNPPLLKVTCLPPQPPAVTGLRVLEPIGLNISWDGQPDEEYGVEYSPDLRVWSNASAIPGYEPPAYGDGNWLWLDLSWGTVHCRFYRVGK